MSELTAEERLAALQARRQPLTKQTPSPPSLHEPQATEAPTILSAAGTQAVDYIQSSEAPRKRIDWSWNRVAATGASVVSFASMIVAMGPILKTVESTTTDSGEQGTVELDVAESQVSVAPSVDIQVSQEPVGVAEPPPTETAAPAPADAPQDTTAAPAPTTAPPATEPPATVAPTTTPATEPPTSAPAATAPPATQAPTDTPPPRSEGSGG